MDGHLELHVLLFLRHAVVYGRRERHFLVFAHKPAVDAARMGKEQRVAALPGDGEGLSANLYRVNEVEVCIQVVDRIAQVQAVDRAPERSDVVLGGGGYCKKQACNRKRTECPVGPCNHNLFS